MGRALTAKSIENLRPSSARREIPDRTPLLYVVLQPSGRRRFVLRYRVHGQSRKVTLERGLSLSDARSAAVDAARELERGNDPRETRRAVRQQAALAAADTVLAVCRAYQARDGAKLRTARQRLRLLERHVFPVFGNRPISSIKRGEIVKLLDKIEDNSGARSADLVLAILGRIMKWHALRDETFNSPIIAGMARHSIKDHARSRILSDDELRRVWRASADTGTFGALVRFLLLTASRRGEAGGMVWGEVSDSGDWTLPAARNKTGQPLTRPLSGAALAALHGMPRVVDHPYVFTVGGRTALTNFSRQKKALDAAAGVTDWRLHDLRRTSRSLLARAGVSADHAERCLGHVLPGVRSVYDRHAYQSEMRTAYEKLATLIASIIDPQDNVVPMRR
jgi:integrase